MKVAKNGNALMSTYDWSGYYGTDDFGFSALPGGYRAADGRSQNNNCAYWWTATQRNSGDAYYQHLGPNGCAFAEYFTGGEDFVKKSTGLSVRCVRDGEVVTEEVKRKAEEAKEKANRDAERIRKDAEQRIEKISSYFTDSRDGQKYRSVKIGGKTWMAQNLNYPTGQSWCYGDDNSNCGKYGRLYDWKTAKKVCPAGWHLPSRSEWTDLSVAANGDNAALKSTYGWINNGNGTDGFAFSALPGGYRLNSIFSDGGSSGCWLTASSSVWVILEDNVPWGDNAYHFRFRLDKNDGYSVRCVKD
jgi:uncharacterized protein (TIGR02145 family)